MSLCGKTELIDYDEGLGRFSGKAEPYRKYLRKFLAAPELAALRDAMAQRRYDDAFAYAHTLKGNAGNLSLTAVYARASELTEALREGADIPMAQRLLPVLEQTYRDTVSELTKELV